MPILNYISFASGLLPPIAAILNYRNLNYTLKLIAAFLLITFLIDACEWLFYLGNIRLESGQLFFHLSISVSFVFYSWIYYRAFYQANLKKFTLIAGLSGLLVSVFFAVKNSIWAYPTWPNTTLSFFMIVVCLLYFNQLFNRQESLHIEEQPLFWFNSGVLIYFSFNIFLFMLFSKLNYSENLYKIHLISNTIANLLFTISLFCKPRKKI